MTAKPNSFSPNVSTTGTDESLGPVSPVPSNISSFSEKTVNAVMEKVVASNRPITVTITESATERVVVVSTATTATSENEKTKQTAGSKTFLEFMGVVVLFVLCFLFSICLHLPHPNEYPYPTPRAKASGFALALINAFILLRFILRGIDGFRGRDNKRK